jgi:hypothetical protein
MKIVVRMYVLVDLCATVSCALSCSHGLTDRNLALLMPLAACVEQRIVQWEHTLQIRTTGMNASCSRPRRNWESTRAIS